MRRTRRAASGLLCFTEQNTRGKTNPGATGDAVPPRASGGRTDAEMKDWDDAQIVDAFKAMTKTGGGRRAAPSTLADGLAAGRLLFRWSNKVQARRPSFPLKTGAHQNRSKSRRRPPG